MTHILISSLRKADRILKNVHCTENFNSFAQAQPKFIQLKGFLLQSIVHQSKYSREVFFKPIVPKKFSRFFNSSFLSRGGQGKRGNKKESSGGHGPSQKKMVRILVNISTAGVLGVFWVYFKKIYEESHGKRDMDNFLGRGTVKNAKTEIDVNKEYDVSASDWIPSLAIFWSYTYLEKHKRFNKIRSKALRIAVFCLDACSYWVALNALNRWAARAWGLGGSLS